MADMTPELRGQPLLPTDRAQGAWFTLLTNILSARSKVNARETYQRAQGYMAALHDADLIDAADLKLMATTVLRALNDALERLHASTDVSPQSSEKIVR
ncbi:hypothetical protein EY04_23925 [Pseudomonas chlororaphis]|uniref:hypothetical protein n=1 Tax=Pseudomonas chlororaphis TaxID=587753 RepID=UPI0004AC0BFC|nr:hypothetical protein [Pseudomonas chlororaphis]AIC21848.1 hypothetical protein EY04_23925 [Pseudomonas chlororaphis]